MILWAFSRIFPAFSVISGAELLPDGPKDAEFCPGDVLSHKLHASISSAPSLLSTADLTPRLSLKASSSHCAEPLGSLLEQQNAAGFDPALGQQCGWSHASTRAPSSSSEVLLSSNRSSGGASGTNGKEPLCESEACPHAKEVRFSASPCDPPGGQFVQIESTFGDMWIGMHAVVRMRIVPPKALM